ncbi:pirin family protein [Hydrogenovibrio kuenenii]|uniref:pirin family protein n=1 Tax=Hydrogenovibrio kuenenii TaxID=63658 RepID=UPI00046505BE|nr:pirin family protein [Hydrogenovibrio kuenenii]
MATKEIRMLTLGMPTSDGAGVKLTRIIGSPELNFLDPFLMLDRFETENPEDYIAGFPPHPHRGFETVTYMLEGTMRHEDNLGNNGLLKPGGIQWMTAGRGIIHSEMPEQIDGAMRGFQLWINLPSHAKMQDPHYQDYDPEQLPVEIRDNGTEVRVISGKTDMGTQGPIVNDWVKPTYFDVSLPAEEMFEQTLSADDNSFLFVISGKVAVGEQGRIAKPSSLAVLTAGDKLVVKSVDDVARFLLISGQPLNEPIARGGPFVMNTQEEIRQAFSDFRQGNF